MAENEAPMNLIESMGNRLNKAFNNLDGELFTLTLFQITNSIYDTARNRDKAYLSRKSLAAQLYIDNPPVPRIRTADQVKAEIDNNANIKVHRATELENSQWHEALLILKDIGMKLMVDMENKDEA